MSTTPAHQGAGKVHVLKTHPKPFAAVRARLKGWEYRYDDRGYEVGDTLWLNEWDPDTGAETGEVEVRWVTYCLRGGQFGIPAGYVIMSVSDCPDALAASERPADPVAVYNAAFDPAHEAGRAVFADGFREGFLFAMFPEGYDDPEEMNDTFRGAVDGVVLGEAWDAHRDAFFARLPLAALPPRPASSRKAGGAE